MSKDTFELNGKTYGDVQYLDKEALTQQPGMSIPSGRYVLAREVVQQEQYPKLMVGDWIMTSDENPYKYVVLEHAMPEDYRVVDQFGNCKAITLSEIAQASGLVKRNGETIWALKI